METDAAHLCQWAAGPTAHSVPAARLQAGAAVSGVTHHLLRPQRRKQWRGAQSGNLPEQRHRGGAAAVAGAGGQVAGGSFRAAVDVIVTADGLTDRQDAFP